MINVMENKVLGPMLHREYEKGREEGRESVLLELLAEKFGALPQWAVERVQAATAEQVHGWVKGVLRSSTLEETLR